MSEHLSSNTLEDRISSLKSALEAIQGRHPHPLWQDRLGLWLTQLDQIAADWQTRPEVAISLIGGTGAGKSTLLNAILGADLLPVSSAGACTAAVCEVSYADRYTVECDFISRSEWQAEVDLLLADLADSDDGKSEGPSAPHLTKASADKIWAVYKPNVHAKRSEFDVRSRVEHPAIKKALDSGMLSKTSNDLDSCRMTISALLDANKRFWPIVRQVRIKGPFPALAGGIKLVDLPGVNDATGAREDITRQHLKGSRYVWIVFNIKRALTGDIVDLMRSDDFLRQIVMDGRADSLSFIGTASDDVPPGQGRKEFGVPASSPDSAIIAARNQVVREKIAQQLDDLSAELKRFPGWTPEHTRKMAERFRKARLFTVSAQEYLRLNGIVDGRFSGIDTSEQTEIPEIKDFLAALARMHGIPALQTSMETRLDHLDTAIRQAVQQRQSARKAPISAGYQSKRTRIVAAAQQWFDRELAKVKDYFRQELRHGEDQLQDKLQQGFEKSRTQLDQVTRQWHNMHWKTLKAIARRAGSLKGATGQHDFAEDLAKPILDSISVAWSDYFGDRLGTVLKVRSENLLQLVRYQRDFIVNSFAQLDGSDATADTRHAGMLTTAEQATMLSVTQTRHDMNQRIEHVRRHLYELIPDRIRQHMATAFAAAAKESGTGLKPRILAILEQAAQHVAEVIYDDAQQALQVGVQELTDWLSGEFETLCDTTARQTALANGHPGMANATGPDDEQEALLITALNALPQRMPASTLSAVGPVH